MIANAADVSERTLFRYFESKDDLLLGQVTTALDAIVEEIARRPSGEPALVAVREALLAVVASRPFALGELALGAIADLGRARTGARLVAVLQAWEGRVTDLILARSGRSSPSGNAPTPSIPAPSAPPDRHDSAVASGESREMARFEASVLAAASTAALRAALSGVVLQVGEQSATTLESYLVRAFDVLLRGGTTDLPE